MDKNQGEDRTWGKAGMRATLSNKPHHISTIVSFTLSLASSPPEGTLNVISEARVAGSKQFISQ